MCGRFTQRYTWREADEFLELLGPAQNLQPRYNIAPSQNIAAVRRNDEGRRLSMLRWGLIPRWASDPKTGSRLINARAETAESKPSFREAYRSRRCLIPADGFYEWKREKGKKQPYLIRRKDNGLLAFAGLWEKWRMSAPEPFEDYRLGDIVETCTILTMEANEAVSPIHHRMPVILDPDAFDPWLAGNSVPLAACPPDGLEIYPVSTWVNSAGNEGRKCAERLDSVAVGIDRQRDTDRAATRQTGCPATGFLF